MSTEFDDSTDVFVLPDAWAFYQAELGFDTGFVVIAGEPHGSCATPTITVDVTSKRGNVTLFLDAAEASEMWTAIGDAIANASGTAPRRVALIKTGQSDHPET